MLDLLMNLKETVKFTRLKGYNYDYIILRVINKYITFTKIIKIYENL